MVYMLLGTGFEETEAIAPLDLLRRAGVDIMAVGVNGKTVYGSHKIGIEADILLSEMDLTNLDMIILPGGLGGVTSVRASEEAMNALRFAWDNGKFVAAICAGPTVLADLGITSGKKVYLDILDYWKARKQLVIPAVKTAWAMPLWFPMLQPSMTVA